MKKAEQIIGFIILCLIMGCEKKTVWSLQNEQKEMIIVDGMITNEKKVHQIKLTFPVQQLNDIPQPVSGAVVYISDKDSVYMLTENPVQKGVYQTSSYFLGKVGSTITFILIIKTKKLSLLGQYCYVNKSLIRLNMNKLIIPIYIKLHG